MNIIDRLKSKLIVSCQANEPDNPLNDPEILAAMAKAAYQGGASGIRANEPRNIKAIRQAVSLPLIGIYKNKVGDSPVYITPDFASAKAVVEAGADIVAIDATDRPHPDGPVEELIERIQTELKTPVMADISTLEEGIKAYKAGADLVATTLSGYTPYSRQLETPDFQLISELAEHVGVPVIAEGRIHSPVEARRALEAGAYAVVVGTAITNPIWITSTYVTAVQEELRETG